MSGWRYDPNSRLTRTLMCVARVTIAAWVSVIVWAFLVPPGESVLLGAFLVYVLGGAEALLRVHVQRASTSTTSTSASIASTSTTSASIASTAGLGRTRHVQLAVSPGLVHRIQGSQAR